MCVLETQGGCKSMVRPTASQHTPLGRGMKPLQQCSLSLSTHSSQLTLESQTKATQPGGASGAPGLLDHLNLDYCSAWSRCEVQNVTFRIPTAKIPLQPLSLTRFSCGLVVDPLVDLWPLVPSCSAALKSHKEEKFQLRERAQTLENDKKNFHLGLFLTV